MNIYIPTITEIGLEVKAKMEGFYSAEILHPDGRVSRPCANVKNTILNSYRNGIIADSFGVSNTAGSRGGPISTFFYSDYYSQAGIALGTDGTPSTGYEYGPVMALPGCFPYGPLRAYNGMYTQLKTTTGNSAVIDATTGNAIFTTKFIFAASASNQTIREMTFQTGNTSSWGYNYGAASPVSRVALATPIVLNIGDILSISYSVVIPTLAVTPQVVSMAAQNGLDLSGQLKLIGTQASLINGTVSASGMLTGDVGNTIIAGAGGGGGIFPPNPRWGLTAASAFPTQLTNTTAMNTNPSDVQGWGAFTAGSFYRDHTAQWNSASGPFTNFNSITLYLGGGTYGYQLLLNAPQTKATGKTLAVSMRFSF